MNTLGPFARSVFPRMALLQNYISVVYFLISWNNSLARVLSAWWRSMPTRKSRGGKADNESDFYRKIFSVGSHVGF